MAVFSAIGVVGNFVWTQYRTHREERRRYAVQVAAWTGPHVDNCPGNEDDSVHHFHSFVVHNGSDQPIYDVAVDVRGKRKINDDGRRTFILIVGLVPPGEQVIKDLKHIEPVGLMYAEPLEVHFTDAHGVRWHRDMQGKLKRSPRRPWWVTAAANPASN